MEELDESLVQLAMQQEEITEQPVLKIELLPHQREALPWLLWREKVWPAGGILADDMGLGKTLTMIALIMTSRGDHDDEHSKDDKKKSKKKKIRGRTLIICPASLLEQWAGEIQNRVKSDVLSVHVYHGSKRETVPSQLGQFDIIITTYHTLAREAKDNATLYQIDWYRVIIDEAHLIRNHKSKISEAVCQVAATNRWIVTGTPIQNKYQDVYAFIKFLKYAPLDDLRSWKQWVDNKTDRGQQRLAAILNILMLRRTKQELQEKGLLQDLPDKQVQEIEVKLDPEEQLVYEKVLAYSRHLFAQFLMQKEQRDHLKEGKHDKPRLSANRMKTLSLEAQHADVKTYEIFVLILRLRQICCCPGLIQTMIDGKDMACYDLPDNDVVNSNIVGQIDEITLNNNEIPESVNDKNIGIDTRISTSILDKKNKVFDPHRISSKIRAMLKLVKVILQRGDKIIIVSQWATMLEIVASHLVSIQNATYSKFTGSVAVKDRQHIVNVFNTSNDPKILLLSLTVGGVGLNLIGGNHLILLDSHWNPQLEKQAEDRIYRFGQSKNVHIYKFICIDTIEQRIQKLQEQKLALSNSVLNGDKNFFGGRLTVADLQNLFAQD